MVATAGLQAQCIPNTTQHIACISKPTKVTRLLVAQAAQTVTMIGFPATTHITRLIMVMVERATAQGRRLRDPQEAIPG